MVTLGVVGLPFLFFVIFSSFTHIATKTLVSDIVFSVLRVFIAYGIAVIVGWSLALLTYKGKIATVALPFFDLMQSIPTSAAIPLVVHYFGASNTVVITFLVVAIIWPVLFTAISGLKMIKKDVEEAVQISRLSGLNKLHYFLMPASLPSIVTGSIIGLGDAWEVLVATEIVVGIQTGLGSFFLGFANNTPLTIFAIVGVLILIFSINKLIWLPLLEKSHKYS